MDNDKEGLSKPKRTDVGYGQPPPEHQFKKGHKPAPRKPKPTAAATTMSELLWQVLQEERPVLVRDKRKQLVTAEILLLKAFEIARAGNSSMRRLVMKLMMLDQPQDCDGEGPKTMGMVINGVEQPF